MANLVKKSNVANIEEAIRSYICPFCRHAANSGSGRTLHLKSCKSASESRKSQKNFKVGQTIRWQGNKAKIRELRDGLARLSDGSVVACSGLRGLKEIDEVESSTYSSPQTPLEWLDTYLERHKNEHSTELKRWLIFLYRTSGYVAHKKWTPEQLQAALKERKLW